MRASKGLRRLLLSYLVSLGVFAVLAAFVVWVGGSVGAFLNNLVLLGLIVMMIAWLVIGYFAGASPSTYIRPDTDGMILLSRSQRLILPQDNPEVMKDLENKLMGTQSDIMMWATGNAILCLGLGILFYLVPVAAVVGLIAAVAVLGALLARSA